MGWDAPSRNSLFVEDLGNGEKLYTGVVSASPFSMFFEPQV